VTGASHQRTGRPCQDALHWEGREAAWVLALADGHGACPRGGEGAWAAVRVAAGWLLDFHASLEPAARTRLALIRDLTGEPFRRRLVQEWERRVLQEAPRDGKEEEAILREHGTTLVCVLVSPEFLLFLQVGDGDILSVDAAGRVSRVLEGPSALVGDETSSLCSPQAWQSMRVAIQAPLAEERLLLVATDGYAKSYDSDEIFERIGPDYLARVRERGFESVMEQLPAILAEVTARGSGDDIALGLIHQPAPRAGNVPFFLEP
jgi:hypothetical protein